MFHAMRKVLSYGFSIIILLPLLSTFQPLLQPSPSQIDTQLPASIASTSSLPTRQPKIALIYDFTSGSKTYTTWVASVVHWPWVTKLNFTSDLKPEDPTYSSLRDYDFVIFDGSCLEEIGTAYYKRMLWSFQNTTRNPCVIVGVYNPFEVNIMQMDNYTAWDFVTDDPTNSTVLDSLQFMGADLSGMWGNPPSGNYPRQDAVLYPSWTRTNIVNGVGGTYSVSIIQKYEYLGPSGRAIIYIAGDNYIRDMTVQAIFHHLSPYPSRYPGVISCQGDAPEDDRAQSAFINYLRNVSFVRTSWHVQVYENWNRTAAVLAQFDNMTLLPINHGMNHSTEVMTGLTLDQTRSIISTATAWGEARGYESLTKYYQTIGGSNNQFVNATLIEYGYYGREMGSTIVYPDMLLSDQLVTMDFANTKGTGSISGLGEDCQVGAMYWNTYLGNTGLLQSVICGNEYNNATRLNWIDTAFIGHGEYDCKDPTKNLRKETLYKTLRDMGFPFATLTGYMNCAIRRYDMNTMHLTYTNLGSIGLLQSDLDTWVKFTGQFYCDSTSLRSLTGAYTWVYVPANTPVYVASTLAALGRPCIDDFYAKVTPLSANNLSAAYLVDGRFNSQMRLYADGVWVAQMNGGQYYFNASVGPTGTSVGYTNITGMTGTGQTMVLRKVLTVDSPATLGIVVNAYDPDGDVVASWTAELKSGSSDTSTWTVYGLEPGKTYSVKVDGRVVDSLVAADEAGNLTFIYTGAWSSHTFVIESSVFETMVHGLLMPIIGLVLIMMVVVTIVGMTKSARKG